MSQEMEDLYQEIILDHHKRPRGYRGMPDATHRAEGNNPMCGDEVEIYLKLAGDQVVDVSFQGQGCAISRASASLMTERVTGKSVAQARLALAEVLGLLKDSGKTMELEEVGDLAALAGVRKFPARVKCATLAWHALEAALRGEREISTE